MSLKLDIEEYPEEWSKEIVAALENYKNGKRNSKRKLRKFVNREISECYYNELIERHAASYRINKDERDRKHLQKIKDVLLGITACVVLFGSMGSTLGNLVVHYGKGTAFWYLLLWIWAVEYTLDDSKYMKSLKRENEQLKDRIDYYKGINEELKAKIEDISNNSQQEQI